MFFRQYLVTVIFFLLLLWGPIDHFWPGWLAVRIAYLILIALIVWLLLGWIWKRWLPNGKVEDVLERILSSLICAALLLIAIFEAISDAHMENTEQIRTRDGIEDVGDYIMVDGPAWSTVFICSILAICVFWFGVLKKGPKIADDKRFGR